VSEIQNTDELSRAYDMARSALRNPGASPGDRKAIMRMTKEGVSPEEMSSILNLQLSCVASLEAECRSQLGMPLTESEQATVEETKERVKASAEGVEYKKKKRMGRPPKLVTDGD